MSNTGESSMITGGDLKRARYSIAGEVIDLPDGGWCIWYICNPHPRVKRRDQRLHIADIVTERWYVDGRVCVGTTRDEQLTEVIRMLMKPAPQEAAEENARPSAPPQAKVA